MSWKYVVESLKYYIKAMRSTILIIGGIIVLLGVSWILGGIPVSDVFSLLSMSKSPGNRYEWGIYISAVLLRIAPILGFVEVKSLTLDEKNRIKASTMSGHTVVVGLGHLGLKILKALIDRGEKIVLVVDKSQAEREEVLELKEKLPVVVGNPSLSSTLSKAGVERAKALIITLDNDLLNAVIAGKAKDLNPNIRVTARIFREEVSKLLIESGKIDVAVSTSHASVPLFITGEKFDIDTEAPPTIPVKIKEDISVRKIEDMGFRVVAVLENGLWKPFDGSLRGKRSLLLQPV